MTTKEYEFYGRQVFSHKPKNPWFPDRKGLCACNCQATKEGIELTLDVNNWCTIIMT